MELNDLRNLAGIKECGPMASATPINPPSPATVSMTAASGSELSGMLKDIMSLAGMSKVEPAHLGVDPPPMKMSPEPVKAVGPAASDGEVMRGIADKLNLDGENDKETDEGNAYGKAVQNTAPGEEIKIHGKGTGDIKKAEETYDNEPNDPTDISKFDAEEFANHENPPGAGKRRGMANNPNATVEEIQARLSEEYTAYKNAVSEDEEVEEEKSWFDMSSKERAAHVASGKSKAHRTGGQPGHSAAPAKTGKGDVMARAADTKAHTGKSEYKGKEDDA